MNKQTITFTASEQTLTKTGGIEHYASNIVSYIEASFTLGDNWAGYDSIRAVWESGYARIATVLDANNKCIVPTEVLTYKSKVNVNLVGSIVENTVLTDRLTTYPILALTVDADARVDSSETTPVTASQFEQFVDVVRDEASAIQNYTYDSEAWAVGQRAGVDVPSTDETYQNNAKYYADQGATLQQEVTDLKSDINGIAVKASASVNQNNPEYEDGVWTDAQTWNASDSYRHSKYFISVETGDVIRFVTDNDINYKGLALYNGNTLVGVTSQNGDYPTDRARTYITIDGVGYFYYTYTIPSGINKISYQRKATIDGVADMVTINSEMPTTYVAYIAAYKMTSKYLATHNNISDFTDAVRSVLVGLNGKKVGFLGDSYTDVSYYYGQKIADETGMIAVANGKQGSRIFSDNSWTSGGQTVTALSFWHRVNLFTDNDFDAICIFGGINDASARSIYETNLGTITDVALTTEQVNNGAVPTTFYQAYKTVVEMLWEKYPNLPLLIIIPPHQLNASYNPSLTSYMGIEAIRNAELSIAEYYGIPVCDLYKSCQELNNYSANVSEYRLSANDIHPNNKGQLAMARFIKQSLSELIK